MLDEALPHWMLAEIEDRETGLNTMIIHDILDRAFDCRGQIDADLVDAEQPISDTHFAAKGQLHVGQTGLFKEKYLTWKHRAIAMKTWNDFKTY
eukprot:8259583-Ditylum_brightwellii.AAC.1